MVLAQQLEGLKNQPKDFKHDPAWLFYLHYEFMIQKTKKKKKKTIFSVLLRRLLWPLSKRISLFGSFRFPRNHCHYPSIWVGHAEKRRDA